MKQTNVIFTMNRMIFVISLTANLLAALECIFQALFKIRQNSRSKYENSNFQMQNTSDNRQNIGRRLTQLLFTQAVGWYSIYVVFFSDVLMQSFRSPTAEVLSLIEPILLIHTGKNIYYSFVSLFVKVNLLHFIHQAVTVFCFLLIVWAIRNYIIGMFGVVGELANVVSDIRKLEKYSQKHNSALCLTLARAEVAFTVTFRLLFPLVVLCISSYYGNPLKMKTFDILIFFFYVTFTFIMNSWHLYQAIINLHGAKKKRKLQCIFEATKLQMAGFEQGANLQPSNQGSNGQKSNILAEKRKGNVEFGDIFSYYSKPLTPYTSKNTDSVFLEAQTNNVGKCTMKGISTSCDSIGSSSSLSNNNF